MFFFSSRRRHTRYWRDWSSDVCSSDLPRAAPARAARGQGPRLRHGHDARGAEGRGRTDQGSINRSRSEERRVGKSVDLGGRRIIKKKNKKSITEEPGVTIQRA